jgi:hypothetical protein
MLAASGETLSVVDRVEAKSPRVALRFEPNLGQAEPEVRFLARAAGYSVAFLEGGAAQYFFEAGGGEQEYTVRLEFLGRNPEAALEADGRLPSVTNFYAGDDPDAWVAGIPNYGRLRVRSLYPEIDLDWRGRGGDLEQVFTVAPGGDPDAIRIHFPEATSVQLDESGAVRVGTSNGHLRIHPPYAYQEIGGRRHKVEISYCLDGRVVCFRTGTRDRSKRLIIDPTLNVSTYVGGAGYDRAYAVAVDASGAVYVAGETSSVRFTSVGTGSPRTSRDLFVSKLAAGGASLAWSTIVGSSANDSARAVALGPSGTIYAAGVTSGSNFPATTGAYQRTSGGSDDAVVVKLSSTGTLTWATYIGEASADVATGLAVDAAGNAYVAGYTASPRFPTTAAAPQRSYGGGATDAFLLKLNAAGTALTYSTLIGGTGSDAARGVAITTSGVACIAGVTQSANLPVRNAYQSVHKGNGDALVACLSAAGDSWNYLTYIGGAGVDEANAIALDASGNAWVAGTTFSTDFPVAGGPYQAGRRGGYDAFVLKLAATGATLSCSSYFGGSGSDTATAVALDAAGAVWVAGYTNSIDLPTSQAWQANLRGGLDGFVVQFAPDLVTLGAASYLGGSAEDRILAIAIAASKVVVAGVTASTDFPVTSGASQTLAPALSNGFVSTWTPGSTPPVHPTPPTTPASTRIGVFATGTWSLDTGDFIWTGPPTDRTGYYGTVGDIPVVGDFNGDGIDEVAVFRRGTYFVDYDGDIHWDAPPTGDKIFPLGLADDIPVIGDWNGDGKVEFGIFRNGVWMLDYNGNFNWDGATGGDRLYSFGQAGDIPVVGDWSGDRKTKIGVFRNGTFLLDLNGNGNWDGIILGDRQVAIGVSGDTPVVGDWNGDGRAKAGIFSAGVWKLDYNGNGTWDGTAGGDKQFTLGASGETPVVGDWNGDGKAEVGTFKAGTWKLDYNGNWTWDGAGGGDKQATLGTTDVTPVVGKW